MINLLPPDLKEQIRFAKMNRLALRYLRVVAAVVGVLAIVFAGSIYYLGMQSSNVTTDLAAKDKAIADLNKSFIAGATDASTRLNAIKYVQANQTRFSAVVADVAKVVPQGVSIDNLTLTGDDKTPVKLLASMKNYNQALAFRNALVTSPRIASADLESIAFNSSTSGYTASLVIAFKPGQAK